MNFSSFAPSAIPPLSRIESNILSESSFFNLFDATNPLCLRKHKSAPSIILPAKIKSSYAMCPAWQIPLTNSINCSFLSISTINRTSSKLYSINFSISFLNNSSKLPVYSTLPLPNSILATVSNL